jgi:hypothetical protein
MYYVGVASVEDLISRFFHFQVTMNQAGDLNSCPPDQELGALVKELASWLRLPGSLQAPLQSSLQNTQLVVYHVGVATLEDLISRFFHFQVTMHQALSSWGSELMTSGAGDRCSNQIFS